jgi:hypothetical protein
MYSYKLLLAITELEAGNALSQVNEAYTDLYERIK